MWPPITTTASGCSEPGISPMTSPLSASGSICAPISKWIFTGTPSEYRRPIMSASSGEMAAVGILGWAWSYSMAPVWGAALAVNPARAITLKRIIVDHDFALHFVAPELYQIVKAGDGHGVGGDS